MRVFLFFLCMFGYDARIAQVKSSEIKEKMGEAEETEKEIEARSNEYRPVAKRASLLYFCLADLAVVREIFDVFCHTVYTNITYYLTIHYEAYTPEYVFSIAAQCLIESFSICLKNESIIFVSSCPAVGLHTVVWSTNNSNTRSTNL